MDVLVPFAADEPKTRLDPVLGPDERAAFARAMLLDVCDALKATGREPTVLATATVEVLLHGEGRARRWLVDAGFGLEATDGRVAVGR